MTVSKSAVSELSASGKPGLERYEKLHEKVFGEYAQIYYVPLKTEAISHTALVDGFVTWLGTERHQNVELLKIAALLHDYARFAQNQLGHHAQKSAGAARVILEERNEFTPAEIEKVCRAIAHHSDKDRIDSPFEDTLKDADVLASWTQNPTMPLSDCRQARLARLLDSPEE